MLAKNIFFHFCYLHYFNNTFIGKDDFTLKKEIKDVIILRHECNENNGDKIAIIHFTFGQIVRPNDELIKYNLKIKNFVYLEHLMGTYIYENIWWHSFLLRGFVLKTEKQYDVIISSINESFSLQIPSNYKNFVDDSICLNAKHIKILFKEDSIHINYKIKKELHNECLKLLIVMIKRVKNKKYKIINVEISNYDVFENYLKFKIDENIKTKLEKGKFYFYVYTKSDPFGRILCELSIGKTYKNRKILHFNE